MNEEYKKDLLKKVNFKCQKCGYYSPLGEGLEIAKGFDAILCEICANFAPDEKDDFLKYLSETLEWQHLETFRRFGANRLSKNKQKKGMVEKSKNGKLMARPPFGYKVIEGNLIPDEENAENVRLIFEEFSNGKSLNQISQIYGISVNGIKKILKNFTYLGKIKFNNQISQGSHKPLITAELFNRVQQIFDKKNKE